MPRSGSELLMHHLAAARNLDYGGEFLCQTFSNPMHVVRNVDRILFKESYSLAPIDKEISLDDFRDFVEQDFKERIGIINSFERGVIVKAFTSSQYYKLFPIFLDQIFSEFDVIVLTRKDSYKNILSGFICKELNTWHVHNDAELVNVKEKLHNLRFNISENLFIREIQEINLLNTLYKNVKSCYNDVVTLQYEDFKDNPTAKLNDIFNTDVDVNKVFKLSKFIDDHESHIINIDRIKKLYRLYIV
jgi:hypothetical protein